MSDPKSENPIVLTVVNWLDSAWSGFSKDADWSQAPDLIQIILGMAAVLVAPPVLNIIAQRRNRISVKVQKIYSNMNRKQNFYLIIENKSRKILSFKIDILIKNEINYGNIVKIVSSDGKKSNGLSEIKGSCIEIISINPKSDLIFKCVSDRGDIKIYKDKKIIFHEFISIFLRERDFLNNTISIMHQRLMLFMLQIILMGFLLSLALLKIGLFN